MFTGAAVPVSHFQWMPNDGFYYLLLQLSPAQRAVQGRKDGKGIDGIEAAADDGVLTVSASSNDYGECTC